MRFGGLVALDDVSLQVPAGRIVGVIGPNGAGKTTLFNVVVRVRQAATRERSPQRQAAPPQPHELNRSGISRTLQGVGLFDGMTVLENVVTGATHTARTGFITRAVRPTAQRP